MGAKVEFPIGKTLFHLVVNPGTSRCPTVDLELVQTTRNVNGTRNSARENGTTFLDFPLFLGIFQWEEPTKRVPFTAEPEIRKFWLNGKRPVLPCVTLCYPVFPCKYYMLAHHIVVQHKLNEHCVQRLVSSAHFSKLLFSVLSTPRLSFVSFYVLLCTYSSSSVITSPFLSLLVLLGPY